MRLITLFRFSGYLCLTLSTACLGLAESTQIDGVALFYAAIGLVLLAEYLTADRWLMRHSVANIVAVVILLSWLVWFVVGLDFASDDQLSQLLPRAGPLLGVLLVAKLLRPKEASDYWMLHLLGLVQVMLACVLALQSRLDRDNPLFALLLLAYALSLIWAMALFHLYRENEAARGQRAFKPTAAAPSAHAALTSAAPWRTLGAASTLAWFGLAFLLGLLVFFAIPRPGGDSAASLLLPGPPKAHTGFSPGLDLNETTPIEVSDEEVMRVEAIDVAGQRVTLDSDAQRWRGVACSVYRQGRWVTARTNDTQVLQIYLLPDVEPSRLRLSFHVDLTKLQSDWYFNEEGWLPDLLDRPGSQPIFLAEPVTMRGTLPRVALRAGRESSTTFLTYRYREATLSAPNLRRSRRLTYDQDYDLPGNSQQQWSRALSFQLQQQPQRAYWESLLAMPVGPVDAKAIAAKVQELLGKAGIDPSPLLNGTASGEQKRQLRIAVAQALERHLASSPEYGYTLDRPRQEMSIDPTVDFLCNTKQGHCGLYASALALMLRSQRIPARVVIGFRGARWNSLGEYHSVCQYHAHAWVEAFIEDANNKPIPDRTLPTYTRGSQKVPEWIHTAGSWLTLDPTPAGGTAAIAGAKTSGFIDDEINFLRYLWEFFILEYSGDLQRERLLDKLNSTFNLQEIRSFWETILDLARRGDSVPYLVLLGVIAVIFLFPLLVLSAWRWRRALRRDRQRSTVPFYARFLGLMERLRLRPKPAQTPAEFADLAAEILQASPRTIDAAKVPPEVVDDFYQVRFGGRVTSAVEQARIDASLDRLEHSLKK